MKPVRSTLLVSLFGNIFLILIKVITGIFTNTIMLIADGIHSFSDLITDVISLFGEELSEKKADKKHPIGYGKMQYLTSLVMGIVVVYIAVSLVSEVFTREINVINNHIIPIVVLTIIVKNLIVRYLRKKGKQYNNNILISSAVESKADELSSTCVLITTILSNFSNIIPILKYSDIIGTLIISLFILKSGFIILKTNLGLLIDECETNEELLNSIKEIIYKVKEVKKINGIMLMKLGYYYNASIKISVDENLTIKKANKVAKKVKSKILNSKYNIKYVTMNVNPYEEDK